MTLICFGNKITLHCTVLNVCKADFGQINAAQWLCVPDTVTVNWDYEQYVWHILQPKHT